MWSFRVEPDQILHENDIELCGFQQQIHMIIDELFLDGSVEPFAVCVHLRHSGIRVVMLQMEFLQTLGEVLLELRTIVREDMLKRDGEDHLAEAEELLRGFGGMRGGAPCKAEATVEVFKGDDIASAAMDEAFDGIECHTVTGVGCLEVLRLPEHLLPVHFLRSAEVIDLLREDPQSPQIVEESPHGGDRGDGKLPPAAEPCQKDLQLLLAEIRMLHAQSLHLLEHLHGPSTQSFVLWYLRSLLQRIRFAMTFP